MECSNHHFDAIVVGAGIMGSSTAYQLAKRGQKTLLLEQFDFLHHRGSSHGESRTIRATYPEDYYCDMVMESLQMWEQAQSEAGYKTGSKCPTRFSGMINIPEDWFGVLTDVGGVIKPTKAVSMFQALAFQRGAVLRDNMEVKNVVKDEVRGGVNVETANGEKFWGEKCVITAGAWARKLVKTVAGLELPIQALETTVCYWRIKEGKEAKFAIGSDFPTFASYGEPYVYGTPSLEFPGLIKIALHGGYPL
ncbi:hypothetical protein OIU78_001770 [Salix suchowensis]|nr:hypothetical protein OIU78_001770 [Salix suchowensis]